MASLRRTRRCTSIRWFGRRGPRRATTSSGWIAPFAPTSRTPGVDRTARSALIAPDDLYSIDLDDGTYLVLAQLDDTSHLLARLDSPGPGVRRFDSDGELIGEYDHLTDAMA